MSPLEDRIHQLTQLYVDTLNKRDLTAVMKFCAADAIVLSSGSPPAKGEEAIRRMFQSWLDAGLSGVTIASSQVQYSGSLAAENGEYTARFADRNRARVETGTYIIAYQRRPGEDFKITALVLSREAGELSGSR
jgi:ketosteroid isomerase-like protein